ncbi:SPFH/Band 7/PHB domain protein, partial [Streptomyces sp. G44]|nr:SPFH/Band 7/PHB domain protein [Streptomyces sp. G44]
PLAEVSPAVPRTAPDRRLRACQSLQALPELARGAGNSFWVAPSEIAAAHEGGGRASREHLPRSPATRGRPADDGAARAADDTAQAAEAAAEAVADAAKADGTATGTLPAEPPR